MTVCSKPFPIFYCGNHILLGQLGHGKFESCAIPKLVNIKYVRQVACGAHHSACIADPGPL